MSAGSMVRSTPEISALQGNLYFSDLLSAYLKYVSACMKCLWHSSAKWIYNDFRNCWSGWKKSLDCFPLALMLCPWRLHMLCCGKVHALGCRFRTCTVHGLSEELLCRFWISGSIFRGFQLRHRFLVCYSWRGGVPSNLEGYLTRLNETLLLHWEELKKKNQNYWQSCCSLTWCI